MLVGCLALAGVAGGAAITRIHISLTASVTRHVHKTQSDYTCPGAAAPASGDVTETVSLTTTRSSTMVVAPGSGTALFIEPQTDMNNSGRILTHGTVTRTSTLSADGEPTCGENPASCGSGSFTTSMVGGADDGHSGRRFGGIALNSFDGYRDPLPSCKSPDPAVSDSLYRTVPFPHSFMVSCRHGKLTRRLTKSDSFSQPGTSATSGDTTVHLSLTVSRLGPLRGYHC